MACKVSLSWANRISCSAWVTWPADGSGPTVLDPRGELDRDARACLRDALPHDISSAENVDVSVSLVAFGQWSFAHGGSSMHAMLAMQAAMLGSIQYELRDFAEALEYFRDAYWLYHLVEYRLLEGMAHEALGDERQRGLFLTVA